MCGYRVVFQCKQHYYVEKRVYLSGKGNHSRVFFFVFFLSKTFNQNIHVLILYLITGIGISTTIIVFFLNCYYNVILAWAFRYFFASFTSKLPWTECDRSDWATEHCSDFKDQQQEDNRCQFPIAPDA